LRRGQKIKVNDMTIHKLQPEADRVETTQSRVSMNIDVYDIAGAVVSARALRACEEATRSLPIYRKLRWSVTRKAIDVLDDLALDSGFAAQRLDEDSALLAAPGAFVSVGARDKIDYCSCLFRLWAANRPRAEEILARLKSLCGDARLRAETFVIDWYFTTGRGELRSSSFEEVVGDTLHDEAYPSLGSPVLRFIEAFLDAPEPVLILLGPPGGGKTRLVREIFATMTRRKGENAEVMYTTDKRALASDSMFVSFVTGSHDAFVIEDTDHLLKPRTSGNDEMHRFLGVADGIARATKRKIIFTTNLPNVTDIDPALIRPGRCFAIRNLRSLAIDEAQRLAAKLCGNDAARLARALQRLEAMEGKSRSVAQVYRAAG
jgi:hypothetical protein